MVDVDKVRIITDPRHYCVITLAPLNKGFLRLLVSNVVVGQGGLVVQARVYVFGARRPRWL
jgi:hypothetical protein